MKSKELSNRLLTLIVMVCCCQQISAGLVVKTGKNKNSTNINKDTQTATTKHPKITYKAKTTTTKTPEMEITTLLPVDLDIDGRSAYINNQFVADPEETVQDTSSPLYELLQQQIETVMSNAAGKIEVYTNNSPQMKEAVGEVGNDKLKPPQKPLFAYDLGQLDEYDEEDTSEYGGIDGGSDGGEYMPENCEDTQESLGDNDDPTTNKDNISPLIHNNQQNLQNNGYGLSTSLDSSQQSMLGQLAQNKPYDSSNYGPQTQQVTSSIYNSTPNTSNYGSKKPQQNNNKNHNKPKPQSSKQPKPSNQQQANQNSYGQAKPTTEQQMALNTNYAQMKPLQSYDQNNQNAFDQQPTNKQQQSNSKPQYAGGNLQQVSFNNQKPTTKPVTQHSKPKPSYSSFNPKTQALTTPHTSTANISNNPYIVTNPSTASTSAVNPSLTSNYAYGHNSNTETSSSPFSSTSSQKRHLTFRTVASSTQYVSAPLADLMFKFSIGMAKAANANAKADNNYGGNQAQIFNVFNDIETKNDMN